MFTLPFATQPTHFLFLSLTVHTFIHCQQRKPTKTKKKVRNPEKSKKNLSSATCQRRHPLSTFSFHFCSWFRNRRPVLCWYHVFRGICLRQSRSRPTRLAALILLFSLRLNPPQNDFPRTSPNQCHASPPKEECAKRRYICK